MKVTFDVDNGEHKRKLNINDENINQSCKTLFKSFKNNHKITLNCKLGFIENSNENLLFLISIHLIILAQSTTFFLPTHIDNYSYKDKKIYLNNCSIFLKMLLRYKKVIQNIMQNEPAWMSFFFTLNNLMNSKLITSRKCLNIIVTLIDTSGYWTYNHLIYLATIGFIKTLSKALINGYFSVNKRSSTLINRVNHCTQMYYIMGLCDDLQFDYGGTFRLVTLFADYVKKDVERLKSSRNQLAYINYKRQVHVHFQEMYKLIENTRSSTYPMTRLPYILDWEKTNICTNKKCKKNKMITKVLMLCKQCKLVYYCSRKCQKYDWKHTHRWYCKLLSEL